MDRRNFLNTSASSLFGSFAVGRTMTTRQQPPAVMPAPGADGWISLFNGRNLDGWYTFLQQSGRNNDPSGIFRVDNGLLHIFGQHVGDTPETGYLCTTREFANYRLRVEYRWGSARFPPRTEQKRDNGLLIHVVGEDRVFPMCMEFQVQETDVGDAIPVGGVRYVSPNPIAGLPRWPIPAAAPGRGGSAAGVGSGPAGGSSTGQPTTALTRRVSDFEDRDGWNVVECIARGADCAFVVNGRIVNSMGRMERPDPPVFQGRGAGPAGTGAAGAAGGARTAAAAPPALQFVPLDRGRIGIEAEYAEIWLRRIDIRPLTAAELG